MAGIGSGIQALNMDYIPFNGGTAGRNLPQGDFAAEMNRALERAKGSREEAGPLSAGAFSGEARIDKTEELYKQCVALETFLVKNILSGMRKNVLKPDLISSGYAGEIYEDMLWDEYAKVYAENGGFGLAELAYLELTNQRGKQILGRS
ncbi:MAG: rod-binding protein [Spirochaetaceae bacterium]|jgi:flagellar protein FlgJ|nr:rod-binding protein [Spirochaetaceae bacterium]